MLEVAKFTKVALNQAKWAQGDIKEKMNPSLVYLNITWDNCH